MSIPSNHFLSAAAESLVGVLEKSRLSATRAKVQAAKFVQQSRYDTCGAHRALLRVGSEDCEIFFRREAPRWSNNGFSVIDATFSI
jgi:hypothetical protein